MKKDEKIKVDKKIVSTHFPWGVLSLLLVIGLIIDHALLWGVLIMIIVFMFIGYAKLAVDEKCVDIEEYLRLRELHKKKSTEGRDSYEFPSDEYFSETDQVAHPKRKNFQEELKRMQDEKGNN